MSADTVFGSTFGGAPAFRVVVPGRVNLIGDHIDYCGLAVLPAAIQNHTTLLVRPRRDARITIASVHPGFETRSFPVEPDPTPFAPGDWGNYLKAAVAGLVAPTAARTGFDAVLESDIPVAAGLSSSSALVVGVGLAFLESNAMTMNPLDLAECLAAAERYVGTQGGGMDQAIVAAATAGCAGRIDFGPLAVTPVPIPGDWRFIVAHSGVNAEKSGAAQAAYNERTVDVRHALSMVALDLDAPGATYRDLLHRFDLHTLEDAAGRALTGQERDRFLHVVGEAVRVDGAISAMKNGDMATFGSLMTESHISLRDLYGVSLPQLDALVSAFESGGAAGARLTGAGFGGCVVALAADTDSARLIGLVAGATVGPDKDPSRSFVAPFEVVPSAGAHIEPI